MSGKDTFERRRYVKRSFLCAIAMCFLTFSILPLSMSSFALIDDNETEYTRVYSAGEFPENQKTVSPGVQDKSFFSESLSETYSGSAVAVPSPLDSVALLEVDSGIGLEKTGDFSMSEFATVSSGNFDAGVFRLDELDKRPRLVSAESPKYPPSLFAKGIEGRVLILVLIDEDGFVHPEKVLSSDHPEFEASALAAVGKFRYESPLKNGRPVRAKFKLPIPFKIENFK